MGVRHLWGRLFRRSDFFTEVVEKAIEEQAAYERTHVARFDPDVRYRALMQRAQRIAAGKIPAASVALLLDAAYDWERAVNAAEDAP